MDSQTGGKERTVEYSDSDRTLVAYHVHGWKSNEYDRKGPGEDLLPVHAGNPVEMCLETVEDTIVFLTEHNYSNCTDDFRDYMDEVPDSQVGEWYIEKEEGLMYVQGPDSENLIVNGVEATADGTHFIVTPLPLDTDTEGERDWVFNKDGFPNSEAEKVEKRLEATEPDYVGIPHPYFGSTSNQEEILRRAPEGTEPVVGFPQCYGHAVNYVASIGGRELSEEYSATKVPEVDFHANADGLNGFGIVEDGVRRSLDGELGEILEETLTLRFDRSNRDIIADQIDGIRQYPGILLNKIDIFEGTPLERAAGPIVQGVGEAAIRLTTASPGPAVFKPAKLPEDLRETIYEQSLEEMRDDSGRIDEAEVVQSPKHSMF